MEFLQQERTRSPSRSRQRVDPSLERFLRDRSQRERQLRGRHLQLDQPKRLLHRHRDLDSLFSALPEARFLYLSTKAEKLYSDWLFEHNDCLVFGRETRGLPEELLRANWDRCLTIPMLNPNVRSLNLATAVGIVLYEALRQTGVFKSMSQ